MLATDFSPVANIAQAYAVGLALHDSSALELATILDLSFTRFPTEVIPEFALEELRRSSEEDLQRAAETISGLKLTRRVIEGFRPASLIVNEAVSSHADLIVLGTTSKHGLKKLALGSTAEEVIRTAPCPILTVGPQVPSPSANHPISFKRIIYATDFSSQAAKAANLALSLGKRDGAQLYLCNVITEKDGSGNYDYESTSRSSLQALMPESGSCQVNHCPDSLLLHFTANGLSASALIKTPPTTLRAWKPTCLPVLVSYQSVNGTRLGPSLIHK
jgi:nucleotide-binding universal stress UspA family protein